MFAQLKVLLCLAVLPIAYTFPSPRSTSPVAILDLGIFNGALNNDGKSNKFLGIPFAKPPTGNLRFRQPVKNDPYVGIYHATSFGAACPQDNPSIDPSKVPPPLLPALGGLAPPLPVPESEDCLTANVWTPANFINFGLPVVVYIYGGGFQGGGSPLYDGGVVVGQSVDMGQPVIYVSMNYRLNVFGFLGGQEVKDAHVGNLGLQDQLLALQWVNKYIGAFGGDKNKVTLWGQSAGAISIGFHMLTSASSQRLFRGAFMQSGSPLPVANIAARQPIYDAIVKSVNCTGQSDTLSCLRQADFGALKSAASAFTTITDWLPSVDGNFLPDSPYNLLGHVSVPFVSGDCDDEGTFLAVGDSFVTDDSLVGPFIQAAYLPSATQAQIATLLTNYPSDQAQGSPYGTGAETALFPEYKRLASIQGDLAFQAPRRLLLQSVSNQPSWSFLSKRYKNTPFMGSYHTTDLQITYSDSGRDLAVYLINFVHNLNPNNPFGLSPHSPYYMPAWPTYHQSPGAQLLVLDSSTADGSDIRSISQDNFRADAISYDITLLKQYTL